MKGPRPLRELVREWEPGRGRQSGGRPAGSAEDLEFALLAAAWPDAVGPQIARRARPTGFRAGLLTVATAGSAWSHQLSFLEPSIAQALRLLVPQAEVRRLRFIVANGRTKALLAAAVARPKTNELGRSSDAHPHGLDAPPRARERREREAGAEEESLDELLARLRAQQAELDRRRAVAGWRRCARCGDWLSPDVACARCADERRKVEDGDVARVLNAAPWLAWPDVAALAPGAQERAYERVRRRLLSEWQNRLGNAERRLQRDALEAGDRVVAWSYLMMLANRPQQDIPNAVVVAALGPAWARALVRDRVSTTPREARRTPRAKEKPGAARTNEPSSRNGLM